MARALAAPRKQACCAVTFLERRVGVLECGVQRPLGKRAVRGSGGGLCGGGGGGGGLGLSDALAVVDLQDDRLVLGGAGFFEHVE